jgi:CHRD domain
MMSSYLVMNKKKEMTAIVTAGMVSIFLLGGSLSTINLVFAQADDVFKARLSGTQEVPPNESPAGGSAWVKTSNDKIEYEVNVTDIDKANAAHIHLGESGKNGPVVLTLFKDEPTELKTGKLAEANLTASNLEGPLKGKAISDLITAIKDGKAYVNVHSTDFPDGEIRGQLNASSTN